jgi:hypothetical protein
MPRSHAAERSEEGTTGEIKVSKGIKELVPNKLISIAQATCVQDVIGTDNHSVVQRSPAREARRP